MAMQVPLFARQAIYDKKMQVVAYELLFRHSEENVAQFVDGDQASSQVLLRAFGEHRLDEITENKRAFVNFTKTLILSPPMLPPEKLVIEVLENVRADDQVIAALASLEEKGFHIALDDFFITKETKKMLAYAKIIKIDVLNTEQEKLRKYVQTLKPMKFILLAEKIETHEMMQRCIELGFDYFQGYFLCKPQIVRGVKISEGKLSTLRLLSVLQDESTPFDKIVEAIATDATLSYKILRLVNSSAMAVPVEIKSLNQAVSMLGFKAIRNWASYLLMANCSDKPKDLATISMSRAKFCELLGGEIGGKKLAEQCFTVALLSGLDAFLDMPMNELLSKINVAEDIKKALEKSEGQAGEILDIALNYERGNWNHISWKKVASLGVSEDKMLALYADAVSWASEISQFQ